MRESRLAVSYASEDRVLLENTDPIPYPEEQNLDAIRRYLYLWTYFTLTILNAFI